MGSHDHKVAGLTFSACSSNNMTLNKNVKDHAPSCILQLYLSCIIYFQLHAFNLVHCEFQAAHRVEFRTTTPTTWSTKRRYRAGSIFLKENNIILKKMSSETLRSDKIC